MFVMLNTLNTSTIGSMRARLPTLNGRETRRSTELNVSLNFAPFDTVGSGTPLIPPFEFKSWMYEFSSPTVLNWRSPALRCSTGIRLEASGIRMSIGTPDESVQMADRFRPATPFHEPAKVNRWRRSAGVGPYSFCRLVGSSGPAENGIWSSLA